MCNRKNRRFANIIRLITILTAAVILLPSFIDSGNTVSAKEKKKLYRQSITLDFGGSKVIKFKKAKGKVKWSSADKKIAVVNKKGVVSAVSEGKTRITGISDKYKLVCKVNVKDTSDIRFAVITPEPDPVEPIPEAGMVSVVTPVPGRIIIHRGMKSTAPENTVASLLAAVENGYRIIEADVRFTADNVPVIIHDATIDRTSDGSGNVNDLTYEYLNEHNFGKRGGKAGYRIMTLETLIAMCRLYTCNVYLEIKDDSIDGQKAELINSIIEKYDMLRRITFISFHKDNLVKMLERMPTARCGFVIYDIDKDLADTLDELRSISCGELFADCKYTSPTLNEANARLLSERGYPLEAWTYSSPHMIPKEHMSFLTGFTTDL